MKTIIKTSLLTLSGLFLATSCMKTLQDDFKISVNPDAVQEKQSLTILDINDNPIADAKITFSGDKSNEIYTPDGYNGDAFDNSTLDPDDDDGSFIFGIKASNSPSEENPIEVEVEVSAPGYNTERTTVKFKGDEDFKYNDLVLLSDSDLENLTTIVNKESTGATAIGTGTIAKVEAEVSTNTKVSVEPGTIFKNDAGVEQTGELVVKATEFDTSDELAAREFGNLYGVTISGSGNAKTSSAYKTSADGDGCNTYLVVLGYPIKLNVTVGNTKVTSQGEGVTFTGKIKAGTKKEDGTEFTAGDVVSVYYKTENKLSKSFELVAENVTLNDNLEYSVAVTKSGYYIAAIAGCDSAPEGTLTIKNIGSSQKVLKFQFDTFIIPVRSPLPVFPIVSYDRIYLFEQYITKYGISTGLRSSISNAQNFKTIQSSADPEEVIIDITNLIQNGGNQTETIGNTNNLVDYDIPLNIECDGVKLVIDETPIYYRKTGDSKFSVFMVIKDGKIQGKGIKFEDSQEYEFQIKYGAERLRTPAMLGSEVRERLKLKQADIDKICDQVN